MNPQNILLPFRNRFLLLLITGTYILVSCGKETVKPLYSNSILKGMAILSDEMIYYGIDVNAYGPYGTYTGRTDSSGYFKINNVPNGTYSIEFSKKGYGTVKSYGLQVFGNDTVTKSTMTLYKVLLPLSVPPQPSIIRYPTIPGMDINDVIFQLSEKNNYLAFFDTHEKVSDQNYQFMVRLDAVYADNTWTNAYKKFNFRSLYYKSGTKVYLAIYSFNPMDQGYFDSNLGIMVFPTINPDSHSNVITLTMP